jgi:hypothetical protein
MGDTMGAEVRPEGIEMFELEDGRRNAQKKHRSPNYPQISLREAVEKVQLLYEADGKHGAPQDAALEHLGFSSLHGHSRGALSALKKYGLTEERGGRLAPTPRAIEILEYEAGEARHDVAVREAALAPAIYRALWDEFAPSGQLPSDRSLRSQLITDMNFNRNTVEAVIRDFRETLEFAGLLEGNRLVLDQGSNDLPEGDDAPVEEAVPEPEKAAMSPATPPAIATPASVPASNSWKIPLGISRDGEEIYANFQANRPLSRPLLTRLAKHLEFMASEWGTMDDDEGAEQPEH